ncbi:MAG: hypothetical protein PWP27_1906 [Clostridiales bacterium]|jgi:RNA polymerase sporulation-specific sigma factor|nr:hypothetical protein [Clostridiales bacterium]MDK2934096.1 hypothetical protein [Clostridiales bacterium]
MEYALKEWVQAAKRDNREAAEKILMALKPLILSSIKKYAAIHKYRELEVDQEELLQEGYLEVLRLIHDYAESRGVPFLGYVKAHLKYFYMNYFRGVKVIYDSLDEEVGDGDDKIARIHLIDDRSPSPFTHYMKKETNEEVWHAVEKLTPKQKKVIYLYYISEMPMTEIAKQMNMHYMSIVKLKQRAVHRLKKSLALKFQNENISFLT